MIRRKLRFLTPTKLFSRSNSPGLGAISTILDDIITTDSSYLNETIVVDFDIPKLKQIAGKVAGNKTCCGLQRIDQRSSYLVYLLGMHDGTELIARIAHTNLPERKLTSEVATVDFIRRNTSIPVPKILAYCTDPSIIGAEYMIMEKAPGENLAKKWDHLSLQQRKDILEQLVSFQVELLQLPFNRIGSLFYTKKSLSTTSIEIGPALQKLFWEGERAAMEEIDRGPWSQTPAYLAAIGQKELAWTNQYGDSRCLDYNHNYDTYLALHQIFTSMAQYMVPSNPDLVRPVLSHPDLRLPNIQISGDRIVCILDWEESCILPFFLQATYPDFLIGEEIWKRPEDYDFIQDYHWLAEIDEDISRTHLRKHFEELWGKHLPLYLDILRDEGTVGAYRDTIFQASLCCECNPDSLWTSLCMVQKKWNDIGFIPSCQMPLSKDEVQNPVKYLERYRQIGVEAWDGKKLPRMSSSTTAVDCSLASFDTSAKKKSTDKVKAT